jgi:hypothetical protein
MQELKEVELLPCPHCGSTSTVNASIVKGKVQTWIACDSCTAGSYTKQDWNTRHPTKREQKLIEVLKFFGRLDNYAAPYKEGDVAKGIRPKFDFENTPVQKHGFEKTQAILQEIGEG